MRGWLAATSIALLAACEPSISPLPDAAEPVPAVEPLGMLRVRDDRKLILKSGAAGRLPGGAEIVDATGTPIAPERLAAPLPEGARLELGHAGTFVLTHVADEPLRWIRLAHARDEVKRREEAFTAATKQLPKSLRGDLVPMLRLLALVSAAEGPFDGTATRPGDPMASLGIFQWATPRKVVDDGGTSLARFFADLRARAVRCEEGEVQAFFCLAWEQARTAGLDLRSGRLVLDGKPATGEALERALAEPLGKPPLRAYQLIAAKDVVDRVAAQRVKAGVQPRTVGEVLHEPRLLATALLLAVNRPSWLVPVLEAAVARVGTDDAERLAIALRREALVRYPPGEREDRMMRLLGAEVMW